MSATCANALLLGLAPDTAERRTTRTAPTLTHQELDTLKVNSFASEFLESAPRRVYKFGAGSSLFWEATGQGETAIEAEKQKSPPRETEAEKGRTEAEADDDEVPGIRAIRAFFRPRPHTAGRERRAADQSEGVAMENKVPYRLHVLEVNDNIPENSGSLPAKKLSLELNDLAVPMPRVVTPILSQLDRRRRSMAGRRLNQVGAKKPEGMRKVTGSRPASANKSARGTYGMKALLDKQDEVEVPVVPTSRRTRPSSAGATFHRQKAVPTAFHAPTRPGQGRTAANPRIVGG